MGSDARIAQTREALLADPVLHYLISRATQTINPTQIILFGSRARGTHGERSDYDVAFQGSDPNAWARFSLDVDEYAPTLKGVDLINLDKADQHLKDRILNEGIVLYDRSNRHTEA